MKLKKDRLMAKEYAMYPAIWWEYGALRIVKSRI